MRNIIDRKVHNHLVVLGGGEEVVHVVVHGDIATGSLHHYVQLPRNTEGGDEMGPFFFFFFVETGQLIKLNSTAGKQWST